MTNTLPQTDLWTEAADFLQQVYRELNATEHLPARLVEVQTELAQTGTYTHTFQELQHGARLAWRNSNRCIGRLYWKTLKVLDARSATTDDNVYTALQNHLRYATNGGEIRSVITVFQPADTPNGPTPRLFNDQLIRYAGYPQPDGSVLGDPSQQAFTQRCLRMGWQPPARRSAFDVLPWVWQWPGQAPVLRLVPPELVLEVPLEHPDFQWFADLGLRWHAVPVISNMILSVGGLQYTAAPFNGWYMGTEIGSRNLGDVQRYNLLPLIAQKMGIYRADNYRLWKDRALVELNTAVLYSFDRAGVRITDHHTAAEQFVHFENTEAKCGRPLHADWSWIVPPMSGSATEVFHREYDNRTLMPNFLYREPAAGKCPMSK